MRDVNWWLMALSFLLGLLLTLAMMIRRVTREVPVGRTATLAGSADKAAVKVERVAKKVEEKVDRVLEKEPYGAGSIRVSARTAAPAGYTIKGDKDTGRYFTLDSPDYADIEAEVWFADEGSAQKGGFLRWDAKGDHRSAPAAQGAAAVITEHHVPAEIVIKEVHEVDSSIVVLDSDSATTESTVKVVPPAREGKPKG